MMLTWLTSAALAIWWFHTLGNLAMVYGKRPDVHGLFAISAFAMTFVVHLAFATGRRWKAYYILLALAVESLRFMYDSARMPMPDSLLSGLGIPAGISAVFLTTLRMALLWRQKNHAPLAMLARLTFWTVLCALGAYHSIRLISVFSILPVNYDPQLYLLERAIGIPFMEFFGRLNQSQPHFAAVTWWVYIVLPGALLFVYLLELRRNPDLRRHILLSSTVSCFLTVLYVIAPGCGPLMTFRDKFPNRLPDHQTVLQTFDVISRLNPDYTHNAMPSFHAVWIFLLLFHMQGMPWPLRVLGGLFAAATFSSMLGTGYHYTVDIIVALPLAVAIYGLTSTGRLSVLRRAWVSAPTAAICLAWLLMIRYLAAPFYENPPLVWLAVAATLGVSLYLNRLHEQNRIQSL